MAKFGLFGSLQAKEGKGDQLSSILVEASNLLREFNGCIEYAVSVDLENQDLIYIYEIWTSSDAHQASLQNENVRNLIGKAMPILKENQEKGKRFTILSTHH